jgi:hypothetical protein
MIESEMPAERTYRAGASVEDYCRACKTDRMHTVIVVDERSQPLRVTCGYCRSQHNYRGGPRVAAFGTTPPAKFTAAAPGSTFDAARVAQSVSRAAAKPRRAGAEPFPIVSDRERIAPAMSSGSDDLELLLRRIIREEAGITPTVPAEKWRGGTLVLRPGTQGLQEKNWPIETFFHKIVMVRNRLRTLEQHINASDLPEDVKVRLQSYVSGCYGSLTSFNVLFADEEDQFKGGGGD